MRIQFLDENWMRIQFKVNEVEFDTLMRIPFN